MFTPSKSFRHLSAPYTIFYGIGRDGAPIPQTKRLSLQEGKLHKDSPKNAGSGVWSNCWSILDGLAHTIYQLPSNACLVAGVTDSVCGRITPQMYPQPGHISRTKDHFHYSAGPALVLLDHDADPQRGGMTPDELIAVLISVCPIFADAGHVTAYSTSSFIEDAEGTPLSAPKPSFHSYFVAADGRDVERFGKVLAARLWLAGYGWGVLSKSGSFLKRCIIDDAVFSPERCIFEAAPILGDGLVQRRPRPAVVDGMALQTHLLPDLSVSERDDYDRLVAAERARLKPEQEPKRRTYAAERAAKTGTTPEVEYRRLVAAERGVISELTVLGPQGETLKELIAAGWHKRYITDPQEPDEPTQAQLFIDGPGDAKVRSYRHGGQWFDVVSDETAEAIANMADTEDASPLVSPWLAMRLAALTELSAAAKGRHDYRRVYPALLGMRPSDFTPGVTLLRGSCGIGKTQKYGIPLAEYARQRGVNFVATCHRVSLTADLSAKMGCVNYQAKDRDALRRDKSLAICINSTINMEFNFFCRYVKCLFIDEISQVLRQVAVGKVATGKREEIFTMLKDMIRQAETVVVADADCNDVVVEFLEQCRPNEKFTIIESELDQSHLSMTYEHGGKAFKNLCGDVLSRLAAGQHLIVASDSKKKLHELKEAVLFELPDKKVLVVHSDDNGEPDQVAFMQNPNAECLRYDLVLHSPSMSSGVSIQVEHFDHGYGLFFGVVTPSDAHQMLRRVRNLTTWHLALIPNHGTQKLTEAAAISQAMLVAARLDGRVDVLTDMDTLKARVEADENLGKGHFAAGLITYLRRTGFSVVEQVLADDAESEFEADLSAIKDDLKERRIAEILDARVLSDVEADRLRRLPRVGHADQVAITRWTICKGLGVVPAELAADDVVFWDGGRGLRHLHRYELATGQAKIKADHEKNLSLRTFDSLRVRLYADLLEPLGVDLLTGDGEFGQAEAKVVVDRVMRNPALYAFLRLAPSYKARPLDNIKVVQAILQRLGLGTDKSQRRIEGKPTWFHRLKKDKLDVIREASERRLLSRIANTGYTGTGRSVTAEGAVCQSADRSLLSVSSASS